MSTRKKDPLGAYPETLALLQAALLGVIGALAAVPLSALLR